MSTSDPYENLAPAEEDPDVPDWDDGYLDRVSDRLMFNYDLEKGYAVDGERFTLYGEMQMHHQKHFLHPMLSFAHHDTFEYVFARRQDGVRVTDLERLVEFGHDLADERIEADEEHHSTEFIFALVTEEISDDVREFVAGFRDRTMLKRGYFGHYEVRLLVVAPDREEIVSSRNAHVEEAFRLWEPIEEEEPTWWDLLTRRLQV
ncbi:MAG: hypothetical protein ABEH90_06260 [Halolamina sp.]